MSSIQKRKILHICSGDIWGGSESQVSQLVSKEVPSPDNTEYEFTVLLFNQTVFAEYLQNLGISTIIIEEEGGSIRLFLESSKFLKHQPHDLILSHGYKEAFLAFLLSLRHKVKWVLQVHGGLEAHPLLKKLKMKFYLKLELLLARFASVKILFVSHELMKRLGFQNSDKSMVIHNATNIIKDVSSTNTEPAESQVRVLWIGRVNQIKRPELLLKSAALFQRNCEIAEPVSFELAGDGPLLPEMKNLAHSLEIKNLNFHGFVENVYSFYKGGGILLLTSDSEGIPTVILEAMQFGIPVIARSIGGIPEIAAQLDEYPMFLIENDSPELIAETITHTVKNYSNLRNKALQIDTSYFQTERMIKEHLKLYQNLLT